MGSGARFRFPFPVMPIECGQGKRNQLTIGYSVGPWWGRPEATSAASIAVRGAVLTWRSVRRGARFQLSLPAARFQLSLPTTSKERGQGKRISARAGNPSGLCRHGRR
jgi:hypothetical protein